MGKLARINAERKKNGLPVDNNGYKKVRHFTRADKMGIAVEVAGKIINRSLNDVSVINNQRSSKAMALATILAAEYGKLS
jgi:hypothetical protein